MLVALRLDRASRGSFGLKYGNKGVGSRQAEEVRGQQRLGRRPHPGLVAGGEGLPLPGGHRLCRERATCKGFSFLHRSQEDGGTLRSGHVL